ncbi:MAG TPA: biotin--[acetyl-CoA-carboxylase] ligase [Actinobacteria bacterium]|nr:biotin--[acetyl-CoA-carboxylase] ligase [Actinomycetota bacterium]
MKTLPEGEGRRPALSQARLADALLSRPGLWRQVLVVAGTGSTNADLLAQARSGAREGLVLVAEEQTAGRGRMGRRWISAPGAALTFSVLLRAGAAPPSSLGWVPLLAGVAVASALRQTAAVDARLKWPNDVLAGDAKLAGILAESWGDAIVVGIGINVSQRADELPVPGATSVFLAAAASPAAGPPGRERLLIAVLTDLARWYQAWLGQDHPGDADGCGLRQEYLRCCATVGKEVIVLLPGDRSLAGTAVGVDPAGQLEVRTPSGLVRVSAGDVVHLR